MQRKETFDHAAKIYDASRPSYPNEVIDWIVQRTGVRKEDRLLEIGPGTGQATFKFAERGYKIHCVERGRNLAKILQEKGADYDLKVDVSDFEKWQMKIPFNTSFIFSATAFHWLDPTVKYKKCYDLLEDKGYLVLLWHVAPKTQLDEVKKAYDLLWEYYPEREEMSKSSHQLIAERKQEIENSGYFVLEDYLDYRWKLYESRAQLTKSFFSQSSFIALDSEKQKVLRAKVIDLYQSIDDPLAADMHTTVYIARKKEGLEGESESE